MMDCVSIVNVKVEYRVKFNFKKKLRDVRNVNIAEFTKCYKDREMKTDAANEAVK